MKTLLILASLTVGIIVGYASYPSLDRAGIVVGWFKNYTPDILQCREQLMYLRIADREKSTELENLFSANLASCGLWISVQRSTMNDSERAGADKLLSEVRRSYPSIDAKISGANTSLR